MALTFHPRPQNPAPPLDDIPRLVEIGQLSPRDALHLMSTNTTVKLPASRENLSKRVEAGDGTGRERTADDSPGRGMQPSSKVDEALKELETLIGLDEVKHLVKEISAFVEI